MRIVLDSGAYMPTKAHESDAGYDLRCMENVFIGSGETKTIETGVHFEIPHGECGLLVSKSGLMRKHGILTTGLVDSGYTGSVCVMMHNFGADYVFQKGDKISQIVFLPMVHHELEVSDGLDDTERGDNGFGSSGR